MAEDGIMDTRRQPASTKTKVKTRPAKKAAGKSGPVDVGELFVAELAARRARLEELLRLIRMEVACELGPGKSTAVHRACRRVPATRVHRQMAMRAANRD